MSLSYRVCILKLDHRPERDKRVTTHAALVARAFGADGFYLSGICDRNIRLNLFDIARRWGGEIEFSCINNPVKFSKKWREEGGELIHLTMYGLQVDDVIDSIRASLKDKLVIIGGSKVDPVYYELADYNVAIGNQPHSEIAALAVFLDRLFKGRELYLEFSGGTTRIIPSPRGKRVGWKK
ncbi:MAG: tRNA (cytidine(56)-2'-O)-methyltransferase [Desulfurococcales archaeon]|nr:tRNA (cytidine(56)-2'-O)-methyltransferase [Desulfurococcales archaeon]